MGDRRQFDEATRRIAETLDELLTQAFRMGLELATKNPDLAKTLLTAGDSPKESAAETEAA